MEGAITASHLGGIFGAFVGIYLVSRLFLRVLKRLGDTLTRIVSAHAITLTLALALVLWTSSPASEVAGNEWTWSTYVMVSTVLLALDLLALRGRRAVPTSQAEARDGR